MAQATAPKLTRHSETGETVILCRSADRRSKERAMHDKLSRRIEEASRYGGRHHSVTAGDIISL
jgi:hypothetical protein